MRSEAMFIFPSFSFHALKVNRSLQIKIKLFFLNLSLNLKHMTQNKLENKMGNMGIGTGIGSGIGTGIGSGMGPASGLASGAASASGPGAASASQRLVNLVNLDLRYRALK